MHSENDETGCWSCFSSIDTCNYIHHICFDCLVSKCVHCFGADRMQDRLLCDECVKPLLSSCFTDALHKLIMSYVGERALPDTWPYCATYKLPVDHRSFYDRLRYR